MKKLPVIFIMGPTASGKTSLAIDLVQQGQKQQAYPFEIISVDSALIYKDMNIGTAKPSQSELDIAPHHLIDFLDPALFYSVAEFRQQALSLIDEIHNRNKIPLLVGGTMLYHRALLYGLSTLPKADAEIRAVLEQQLIDKGAGFLHQKLAQIDPVSAKRIHPNDPQRVQRALEVHEITGKTLTQLQKQSQQKKLDFPCYKIVIAPDTREILRERIAIRFRQMLEQGFVKEVQKLKQRSDLSLDIPSMRCVGYRQVWEYLQGDYDYEEMIERGINVTRQFAKRQMTWLKKEPDALQLISDDKNNINKVISYLNLENLNI